MQCTYIVVGAGGVAENLIIGNEGERESLTAALGVELDYAPNIAVEVGDLRAGGVWTRNIDGVQTPLTTTEEA